MADMLQEGVASRAGEDLLVDLLDSEREEAHGQARWLSFVWIVVTVAFLIFTLLFVVFDNNPSWLARQAEDIGAPTVLAQRLDLAALAPVLANVSGAVFLNFWRVRRRKLRLILAEAMVLDQQYGIARGVLLEQGKRRMSVMRRMTARFAVMRRRPGANDGAAGRTGAGS